MCVIIASDTVDHTFDRQELEQVASTYPHGLGIMSTALDKPIKLLPLPIKKQGSSKRWSVETTSYDPQVLDQVFAGAIQGQAFLLHGRQATHGLIDTNNIHPFNLGNKTYFAHNGILQGPYWQNPLKSDSAILAEVLAKCDPVQRMPYLEQLTKLGHGKFIVWQQVLNKNKTLDVMIDQTGHTLEPNGCYYSNTYHKFDLYDVGGTCKAYGYDDDQLVDRDAWPSDDRGFAAIELLEDALSVANIVRMRAYIKEAISLLRGEEEEEDQRGDYSNMISI